jgi:hypothetical protein
MPLKICGKSPQKSAACNRNAGRLEDRQIRELLSPLSLLSQLLLLKNRKFY